MKLADKIKHFINYGRKGFPEVMPVQFVYRPHYSQRIKAVWSIDLPIDINESEYLNEKLIKDNLARKIADEITKYMKIEKRPPLINFRTKKVDYEAEITILVDTTMGGEEQWRTEESTSK